MLERIENVNEQVIEKMFLLYAESMADMEREFKDRDEMEASYAAFLKEFIENPKQMVFVETAEKQWVCGLRAVESEPGKWFLEAVETMPGHRNRGYVKTDTSCNGVFERHRRKKDRLHYRKKVIYHQ